MLGICSTSSISEEESLSSTKRFDDLHRNSRCCFLTASIGQQHLLYFDIALYPVSH